MSSWTSTGKSPIGQFHVANSVTYLSVFAGLLAVVASRESNSWALTGAFIAIAALADMLDGKFASLFRRSENEKAFGAQLDSLADAICFGVVPVVSLYQLTAFETAAGRLLWWLAGFFYVLCALTRLGFYNLQSSGAEFVGIPSTLAGLVWASLCLQEPAPLSSGLWLFGLGLAMVAPLRIPRPGLRTLAIFILWAVGVLASHLFHMGLV